MKPAATCDRMLSPKYITFFILNFLGRGEGQIFKVVVAQKDIVLKKLRASNQG
jgi:hypothetical protein